MGYQFDGDSKIITLTPGTTTLDVRDLYSRWKDWFLTEARYGEAFAAIGGDPIDPAAGIYITAYYFLQTGWRIRPQEASHRLKVINGVILVADGSSPFLDTLGSYNVQIQYSQPVKTETVATGGGSGPTPPTPGEIADEIFDAQDVESGLSFRNTMRLLTAALAGKLAGAEPGSTTIVIKSARPGGGTKNRIVATVDQYGNRSELIFDLTDE